jgi:hypothetical protein
VDGHEIHHSRSLLHAPPPDQKAASRTGPGPQAWWIGAAGFDSEHGFPWALGWAWFHPYARRRGYLSQAWPYFRKRFGGFILEPPLSEAMEAFVAKNDPGAVARSRRAIRKQAVSGKPGDVVLVKIESIQ